MQIEHLAVNNSLINSWIACPRRAFFEYVQKKMPVGTSINKLGANIGTCVHAALEAHYTGKDIGKTIDQVHSDLDLPNDGRGSLKHIDSIVELYLQLLGCDRKVFLAEKVLEMPVGDRLSFRGTLDLVLEESDGSLTLIDHKTSSNLYMYLKPRIPFDYQFTGYYALLCAAYPDRKVNNEIEVHGMQSKGKPKVIRYKTQRDQAQVDDWLDWVNYWGYEIMASLENKKDVVANKGAACVSYGSVCPYANLCLDPAQDFNQSLLESINDGYEGFRLVKK